MGVGVNKKSSIITNVLNADLKLLNENPKEFWKKVHFIGPNAFSGCNEAFEIEISKRIYDIQDSAFEDCLGLERVHIKSSVYSVGILAFSGCVNLKEAVIDGGVSELGNRAFASCLNLKSIKLPDGAQRIPEGFLCDCVNLEKIEIPESVTLIENFAFSNCRSLKEIIIPKRVQIIESDAFSNCSSLEKVILPQDCSFTWAFSGCRFNYIYKTQMAGKGVYVLSREKPQDKNVEDLIDINELERVFTNLEDIDYASLLQYTNVDSFNKLKEMLIKANIKMPSSFFNTIMLCDGLQDFVNNNNFKFFKDELKDILPKLEKFSNSEVGNFFMFAKALGCFSTEKLKNTKGIKTNAILGQKACSVLRQLISNGYIELGEFSRYFEDFNMFSKEPDSEFLAFIGFNENGKFKNAELLRYLESDFTGVYARTMLEFDSVLANRVYVDEHGKSVKASWEDAIKRNFLSRSYSGVRPGDEDIAEVYMGKSISESTFDFAVKLRNEARKNKIPHHILSIPLKDTILDEIDEIKEKTANELKSAKQLLEEQYARAFTYEMLSKDDPKNGIIGAYCDCCATLQGMAYGKEIAIASITQKDVQNMIVRDSYNRIIAKGAMYVNQKFGYVVINDFELNGSYKTNENKAARGYYNVPADSREELAREMIFKAFMRGIHDFVRQYDKEHPSCPIQKVNVGMEYNRLKRQCDRYLEETNKLKVPASYSFFDAKKGQRILYERGKSTLIENEKGEENYENEFRAN